MAKVGVILAGCGVYDGSEIHEAVLTLLYLDQAGAEVLCYAPDKPQLHVVDHLKGEPTQETRNVLVESARIARGNVSPLSSLNVDHFDAIIIPGGFGAAKNLCNYAVSGDDCDIDPDIERIIQSAIAGGKVVGALCISPVVVARALKNVDSVSPTLTIGTDAATAGSLRAMGAESKPCSVNEIAIDETNKIVTTPAYMLGPGIADVASGIQALVNKVLDLC